MKAYFSKLKSKTLCLDTLMCITILEPYLFPFVELQVNCFFCSANLIMGGGGDTY